MNNNVSLLQPELDKLRIEWNSLREEKLKRKKELLQLGFYVVAIRHDKLYRKLKKAQKIVSTKIKHLEIKINRKIASMGEQDGR